jgi:AraC-like DNA-binding protein
VFPDVSTYNREFKALHDQADIEVIESAMGVGRVRHNWGQMKDFAFGLLTCQVGEIVFVNARTTSGTVWKEGIAGDFVTLTRVGEGGGRVTMADGVLDISTGDAYSSSADQGFTCHTPLYQDISLIAIPRLWMRHLGLPGDVLQPRGVFAPEESVAEVLFDFFHSFALRADKGSALSGKALASVKESVLNMAAAVLEENVPAVAPGLHSAAKDFIDSHLDDPELSPAAVAAALHVSKRTLYRSFTDTGHSVASYIRAARLRRVKKELDAAGSVASIREVSERWGFTSGGYFAKIFQREFGYAPSEYARNAR